MPYSFGFVPVSFEHVLNVLCRILSVKEIWYTGKLMQMKLTVSLSSESHSIYRGAKWYFAAIKFLNRFLL